MLDYSREKRRRVPRWAIIVILVNCLLLSLTPARNWWLEQQTKASQPDLIAVAKITFTNPEWRWVQVRLERGIRPQLTLVGSVPTTQSMLQLQQAVAATPVKTPIRYNVAVQNGLNIASLFIPSRDIGPRLHQMGRPANWKAQRTPLGRTGFVASAGPGIYQDKGNDDPDYYTIDVEKREGPSSQVYFQRDFTIPEIPADLIRKPIGQIVSFDEASRTVTFQIGDRQERYRLADP